MYCPQCGQQQISENTSFCSRCGLLISGLAQWLTHGGNVPAARQDTLRKPTSPKRKMISRGAKLMFASAVAFPVFLGFSIVIDTPAPLLGPITIFLAGLALIIYSVIFGDDTPSPPAAPIEPSRLSTMFRGHALPPPNPAVSVVDQSVRTAELVGPPSVTENTTKLLDRE
jgi:endogenous inhibitor of DNA gyrase (YacG/DUF329 family)